jgi:hypothetical protein
MLLYAEIIFKSYRVPLGHGWDYLINFNYYSLNTTVTILKSKNRSAGFNLNYKEFEFNASETIHNKFNSIKDIKTVSTIRPKLVRPNNNEDFGYYLAGLIDGDGHFSNINQLIIVFHINDVSLAYYIKKKLGYGSVRKVKNKNAILLVISSKKGLETVFNFINGKLKHINKINQVNQILIKNQFKDIRNNFQFSSGYDQNLNNY